MHLCNAIEKGGLAIIQWGGFREIWGDQKKRPSEPGWFRWPLEQWAFGRGSGYLTFRLRPVGHQEWELPQ